MACRLSPSQDGGGGAVQALHSIATIRKYPRERIFRGRNVCLFIQDMNI